MDKPIPETTPDMTSAEISNEFIGKRRILFDFTTPEYWDCECEHNFIQPAHIDQCPRCWARREECPDSHTQEVLAAGLPIFHLDVQVV